MTTATDAVSMGIRGQSYERLGISVTVEESED